jgi:hypothetical protein
VPPSGRQPDGSNVGVTDGRLLPMQTGVPPVTGCRPAIGEIRCSRGLVVIRSPASVRPRNDCFPRRLGGADTTSEAVTRGGAGSLPPPIRTLGFTKRAGADARVLYRASKRMRRPPTLPARNPRRTVLRREPTVALSRSKIEFRCSHAGRARGRPRGRPRVGRWSGSNGWIRRR